MDRLPCHRAAGAGIIAAVLAWSVGLGVFATGCSAPRPSESAQRPVGAVVLVALDGFGWDYPDRFPTPVLDGIARRGGRAERLIPAFPTETFPNHYTLVTGLYPGHHGIVSNTMWDEELGRFGLGLRDAIRDSRWWGGEPVWVTAERAGLATAPLFWPGSEAAIGGIRPTHWEAYDHDMPGEERVDKILDWLEGRRGPPVSFATLYFSEVDSAGHDHGPGSAETRDAVGRVDALVGRLLEGLERRNLDHVDVLVVSDHGMAATSPERVIVLDDFLDLETVHVVDWSPVLALDPKPGIAEGEVLAALRRAGPRLAAYRRSETPEHWHYRESPRVPAIVAAADEGWTLATLDRVRSDPRLGRGGTHGYDPAAAPSMGAILYAIGPSFRPGSTVGPVENVDVYALLCRLLGLEPADHDGDPASLVPLLERAAPAAGAR